MVLKLWKALCILDIRNMYQKYAIKLPRENAIIEDGKIDHKEKEGIIVKQDEYVTAVT